MQKESTVVLFGVWKQGKSNETFLFKLVLARYESFLIIKEAPPGGSQSRHYTEIFRKSLHHAATGAERCGQPWFLGVSLSWRAFGGQVRTGADRCGQPWFLGVSLCWRTLGGRVRAGTDNFFAAIFCQGHVEYLRKVT